ncbi:MAG: lysophospholipid acyltransferase family protein [Actinomycetes bacterium]
MATSNVWTRRAVSLPAVVLGLLLVVPLAVVMLPLLFVHDVVRYRRLPTVRLMVFGICYLAWEVVAVAACGLLWVVSGFGTVVHRPWSQHAHRRLQAIWVGSLLGCAERILGLRLNATGTEALSNGPLIVLCRHTSLLDTLIPAKLLIDRGFSVRYVLKDDLLWDPALDLVGNRLPNHFVDRSGTNTPAELQALQQLAATAGPTDALVIFPEGTRWTPAKRARVQAKLAEADPELASEMADRVHTMPPRAGGATSLLDGAPSADVVTLAYVGLDGLAGPREAIAAAPLRHPVVVELWRTPRAKVPDGDEDRGRWLRDEWGRVDNWVVDHS